MEQFGCCGYLSVLDRPFVDEQCSGLVDSTPVSDGAGSIFKRQRASIVDADEDILIQQTPGCQDSWLGFKQSYLQTAYSIAFTIVPLTLATFLIGVLATNHIYD